MPNVIPFPPPVPPEPRAGRHDWLLPHLAGLARYCAQHGLPEEEAALAEAIETLISARQGQVAGAVQAV